MKNNIILRHRVVKAMRDYMDEQGFLEIETPILQKSTPEGARDYLVPSRVHGGEFFGAAHAVSAAVQTVADGSRYGTVFPNRPLLP